MDEEPVARALLVAGVTHLTVGLVTLALGIVFVVIDFEASALVSVWGVAIASGVGAILAGIQLSSFTCHGRSSRPANAACVAAFTVTTVVAVGAQVALLVLSSFHVMKDGSRREIFIFFMASSSIQMVALVVAPLLLLTCNPKISIPHLPKKREPRAPEAQDNYGFIGDSEMWCSARPSRSGRMTRWPAIEHLEKVPPRSSTSSVGSIHPGHYIAGDHHPKFISPSSEEEAGSSSNSTPSSAVNPISNGGVVHAEVHPTAINDDKNTTVRNMQQVFQNQNPTSKNDIDIGHKPRYPQRPPRQRDTANIQSLPRPNPNTTARRSERVTVSTVSRSYSPLGSPVVKNIYLYDPVEMEIVSPNTHGKDVDGIVYQDSWKPSPHKGLFGHHLHGISVDGLHSLGPYASASLPTRSRSKSPRNNYANVSRPRDPPPAIPNGYHHQQQQQQQHHHQGPLPVNGQIHRFTVGEWEDLSSPMDRSTPLVTSTPKHPRRVTFVEADA